MPEQEQEKQEVTDDSRKRAIKRVATAAVLVVAAVGALTVVTHKEKPLPKSAPQETVLPAEAQPVSAVAEAMPEALPASAVAEAPPPAPEAPPVATPPPPPVVSNAAPAPATAPKPATPLKSQPRNEPPAAKLSITQAKSPEAMAAKLAEPQKPATPPPTKASEKPVEKPAPVSKAAETPPPTKGYAVQLGVFTNPVNAAQLQERLTQHGIQSYTETKLNVGPFQNKAEAEQALAKLRGLGISAVVVPVK